MSSIHRVFPDPFVSDACHCQDRDIVKDKLDAEDSNSGGAFGAESCLKQLRPFIKKQNSIIVQIYVN